MTPVVRSTLPSPVYNDFSGYLSAMQSGKHRTGQTLVLCRHAESLFNKTQVIQGAMTISPVTPLGVQQAMRLGQQLKKLPDITSVTASPMLRTQQTAEGALRGIAKSIAIYYSPDWVEIESGLMQGWPKDKSSQEVDGWIAELHTPAGVDNAKKKFSITESDVHILLWNLIRHRDLIRGIATYEGKPVDDLLSQWWRDARTLEGKAPQGESFLDAKARAERLRRSSIESLPEGIHVAVSHGSFLKLLLMNLCGVPVVSRKQVTSIRQYNAAINVLWRENDTQNWQLLVLNSSQDPDEEPRVTTEEDTFAL